MSTIQNLEWNFITTKPSKILQAHNFYRSPESMGIYKLSWNGIEILCTIIDFKAAMGKKLS